MVALVQKVQKPERDKPEGRRILEYRARIVGYDPTEDDSDDILRLEYQKRSGLGK